MSLASDISPRDQQAIDLATSTGDLTVPTAQWVSELSAERGVSISLARHLARVEGAIEGPRSDFPQATRFVWVRDEWPTGTDPTSYPSATILPMGDIETAVRCSPYRIDDETGAEAVGVYDPDDVAAIGTEDLVSADGQWALWVTGEDTGQLIVHVFASSRPQRNAMQTAVEQALHGSLDRLRGLALPLPEYYLPRPFRRLLPPSYFPRALCSFVSSARVDDQGASASGIWRADIKLTWQALRLAARPRIADLRADVVVLVGPPGQEVL
jgi:hypothetical protein